MRTEQEMMDLILAFARNDERVRMAGIEGSRTNPHVAKDRFQDYDVSLFVTDMQSYQVSDDWLSYFGPRIIMQKPEAMALFPPDLDGWFSYLMLFEDGNRIDLVLIPVEQWQSYLKHGDGLAKILLDKDQRIICPPTPTDAKYHVQKPSQAYFEDCCNEFWWVCTYVVKALCRQEFVFAAEHLHTHVRAELLRMMSWQVGIETNFSLSVGKSYKFLERYVSVPVWQQLCSTYNNGTYEELWQSLNTCCALFERACACVAQTLGYPYPDYAEKVWSYAQSTRALAAEGNSHKLP